MNIKPQRSFIMRIADGHIHCFAVTAVLLFSGEILRAQTSSAAAKTNESQPVADEEIFSGPQIGESFPSFVVHGVFDEQAGKETDYISIANGRPVVLIFMHDVNRQSISLTRVLATYTNSRAKDGLVTGVILLHDDATEAESMLKRIRHAIGPVMASVASLENTQTTEPAESIEYATVGISTDGREGPGSYGLNRNVTLTVLVGKDNKVTANFALVQPSLQVDLPKILESIVAVAGGPVPKLEDLEGMPEMRRRDGNSGTPNMRPLLAPVIRRDATEKDVIAAAEKVEEAAAKDEAIRKEVGRITNTIINAGKLEDYGTSKCQEYLAKWAKAYGDPERPAVKEDRQERKR
jgi:hypothetical protein